MKTVFDFSVKDRKHLEFSEISTRLLTVLTIRVIVTSESRKDGAQRRKSPYQKAFLQLDNVLMNGAEVCSRM